MISKSMGRSSPGASRPRHVLVLDISKSMLAPLPDPSDPHNVVRKIEVARAATFRIFEEVQTQGAMFGLVVFNSGARVALPLQEVRPESRPALDNIIALLQPSGKSAIWDALALGADLLRIEGGGVVGNLVLVTDGWDNMSQRFTAPGLDAPPPPPPPGYAAPPPAPKSDIVPYTVSPGSRLALQIIGIGSGVERDKGVDSVRMRSFADRFSGRAIALQLPCSVNYQEVVTSQELFSRMVNAFVDLPFDDSRGLETLHPDEVAQSAASAAKALREGDRSGLVSHLGATQTAAEKEAPATGPTMEVDVLNPSTAVPPAFLKERYGPVGEVAEAYMAHDWARAQAILYQKGSLIPPVTRFYWQARIFFAQGERGEASRFLTQAWAEAEKLPHADRRKLFRRLGLLQAKISGDHETESLVEFFEAAETKARNATPIARDRLETMFDKILELRRTYALVKGGGSGAAVHEALVEEIFGLLQDARLDNTQRDPAIDGFLDFVEIALAEMR